MGEAVARRQIQPAREFLRKPTKEKESKMAFFHSFSLSFIFRNPGFSMGCGRKKWKKFSSASTRAPGCVYAGFQTARRPPARRAMKCADGFR
jgi:hypothetical protein